MECPVCKKGFDEHTGRRPKKFCSDECKVKFWNAFKRVQKEGVDKPKESKVIESEPTPKYVLPDHEAIKTEMAEIRAEKIPDHRNKSSMGRKSWQIEQDNRIKELQRKINP